MVDAERTERELWLARVRNDGLTLGSSPQSLRNDRQVVLEAVKRNPRAIEHASELMRSDKEIVVAALRSPVALFWDRTPLEFASEALRGDREVVIEAVQHPFALQYASETLRCDSEAVLAAVKWSGPIAFRFASESFRTDKEFALAAIQQHPVIFNCISEALCCDPDVLAGVLLREDVLVFHVTMISGKACSVAVRNGLATKQAVLREVAERLSLDPQAVSAQGELLYTQTAAPPLPADNALLLRLASGEVHELQLVMSLA